MHYEPRTAREGPILRFFRVATTPVAGLKAETPPFFGGAGRQNWTTGAFVLTLACALFACFPKITLGTHTWFYRDYGAYLYPLNVLTRNSLLRGELPLWNPYSQCGVPH